MCMRMNVFKRAVKKLQGCQFYVAYDSLYRV